MRGKILDSCASWLNTPYQHQMSQKGVGCDCLGLIRGVWRDIYGHEVADALPPYSPDWAERGAHEALIEGLSRSLMPIDAHAARAGDVVVFRLKSGVAAKHCAILSDGLGLSDPHATIIHAYWGHAVVRSYLHPFWARRVAACFQFKV